MSKISELNYEQSRPCGGIDFSAKFKKTAKPVFILFVLEEKSININVQFRASLYRNTSIRRAAAPTCCSVSEPGQCFPAEVHLVYVKIEPAVVVTPVLVIHLTALVSASSPKYVGGAEKAKYLRTTRPDMFD